MNRVDVTIRKGKLRGIVQENVYGGNYIAFRGIPYAKPPIGELRFQDPVPPESWSGVRDASEFGNISLQKDMFKKEVIVGDEDCLYLNVYTTDVQPRQKRTVMVWIHGGGFHIGSGNHFFYGPDYIVRKDVVLVTLNYRLGALGFLNLNHEIAAGNQGLKDVLMTLRWVQENISDFGGDPENVTIFGESAGSAIVHYLTISPLASGLFHKAIAQSGTVANPWAFNNSPETGFLLAEKLGKQTSDPKIAGEFLKTIDGRKFIEIMSTLYTETEKLKLSLVFYPSMDRKSPNPFFLEDPAVMLRRGVKVPFLLGFNSYEGNFFTHEMTNTYFDLMNSNLEVIVHPNVLPKLKQHSISIDDLRSYYFDKPIQNSEESKMNYANFVGDMYFLRGIYEVADIQMQLRHRPTYMYKFSYNNDASLYKKVLKITLPGTTHTEELDYLFYSHIGKYIDFPLPKRDSDNYRMINCITQMWTDFAKTGNPTPAITDLTPIKWTPLEGENVYKYLVIDKELRMETVHKDNIHCNWKNIKQKQ